MATPQVRPQHGTPRLAPPRGSYLRSHEDAPPVAIPSYSLRSNANALLVSGVDFERGMAQIISSSSVLTAWFTFQAFCGYFDCSRTISPSQWKTTQEIIDDRSQTWVAQRLTSAERSASVDYLKDMKLPELHALAVFVLSQKISGNHRHLTNRRRELTYHGYYQTDNARRYLTAHVLTFLYYHVKPSSPFRISRPRDNALVHPWLLTQGAHIGLACEEFVQSWKPYALPIFTTQKQAGRRPSSAFNGNVGDSKELHTRRGSHAEQRFVLNGSKTVIFRLSGEELFELDSDVIPKVVSQRVQDLSLCDILRRCLGWPRSSTLTGIALHKDGEHKKQNHIETLPELWRAIDSSEAPVFSLYTSASSLVPVSTTPATKTLSRVENANHTILQLEKLTDELAEREARLARALFELIRQDHGSSRKHIQDLKDLFAPIKQRNADEWDRIKQIKDTFDEALSDSTGDGSQILKLEDLVNELDAPHAEDARAIFHLVRRNLRNGKEFVNDLEQIFTAVKQRNSVAIAQALPMKSIFHSIEVGRQRDAPPVRRLLERESCGDEAALRKRKRSS